MRRINEFLESVKSYTEEILSSMGCVDLYSAEMVENIYWESEHIPHGNPYKVAMIISDFILATIKY